MQKLIDKKIAKWNLLLITFAIALYLLYMLKQLIDIYQSNLSLKAISAAFFIFGLGILIFAAVFFIKNKSWIPRWSIIITVITSVVFSFFRYEEWFIDTFIGKSYSFIFEWQQLLAFAGIYFVGAFFIWCANDQISVLRLSLYGFILGCGLWIALSGLLIYSGLLLSWWTMLLLTAIVLFALYFWRRPKLPIKKELLKFAFYSVIFINLCIILPHLIGAEFSYDSYRYLDYGLAIGEHGSLTAAGISGVVASAYALFMPSLNAMSVIFGFSESNTFITIIFACFIAIFSFEFVTNLKENGMNKRRWLPAMLAIITLLATCAFITLVSWHLNNGPAMAVMFLLAITINQCTKSEHTGYAIISAVLFCALIFSRVEMPLFCALLLVIISTLKVTKKQMLIMLIPQIVVLGFYYIGFFTHYGTEVDTYFLTIGRSLPIIFAYFLVLIYLLFIWRRRFIKVQNHMFLIIIGLMGLLLIGLSLLSPGKSLSNFLMIARHTLMSEYWGYGWHLMLSLLPLVYMTIKRKQYVIVAPSITKTAITFSLFIVIIFLFRDQPLRYGAGDSGSRLISQLFPLVVFWLFSLISPLLAKAGKNGDTGINKTDYNSD